MKAYPTELRTRIVAAVDRGMAHTEVAHVFAVSERTIRRYLAQQRHTQDLTPGHSPGRPRTIGPNQAAALSAQVTAQPDATLADHCAIWARDQGVTVSVATMSRALRGLAITLKKKSCSPLNAMKRCALRGGRRSRRPIPSRWSSSMKAARISP